VSWLPSALSAFTDLPSGHPLDIAGFVVEHRCRERDEEFHGFDGAEGRFFASRGRASDPRALTFGADLLELYPEAPRIEGPVDPRVVLEHVLRSPRQPAGPGPGTTHDYRVMSVDAIGRRSAPAVSEGHRLEKHLPPPKPVGPPREKRADEDETIARSRPLRPAGVRAVVLQAADPYLSSADRERLGGRAHLVLLQWAWAAEQRRVDASAVQFRVYWRTDDPFVIRGRIVGAITRLADGHRMKVALSREVREAELVGQFVTLGDGGAFVIRRHGAGRTVVLEVDLSRVTPDRAPEADRFELFVPTDGSEERPETWSARIAVTPITSDEVYELELPDFAIDFSSPRLLRGYLGVSAADAESYVTDRRPAGTPLGGLVGNESAVAIAPVHARAWARPLLDVPPPLADVATVRLPELAGETIDWTLDLAALLPDLPHGGHRLRVERASSAELVKRLVREGDGIAVKQADDRTARWTGLAPGDERALVDALSGTSEVPSRYVMALAISGLVGETVWQTVGTDGWAFGPVHDRLPNTPQRFIYRVKLIDRAGRLSEGAAFVPRVFRIPARQRPGKPIIDLLRFDGPLARVSVALPDPDPMGVALFFYTQRSSGARAAIPPRAELLRVPDRPDLVPPQGIRLRLDDGTILQPMFLRTRDAVLDGRRPSWSVERNLGHPMDVYLWAVAISADGLLSPLVGPATGRTAAELAHS
jgi:hypothetical protein